MDDYVQQTGDGWRVVPMDPREFGFTDEDDIRWLEEKDTHHPYKSFTDPAEYDLARVEVHSANGHCLYRRSATSARTSRMDCWQTLSHYRLRSCRECDRAERID